MSQSALLYVHIPFCIHHCSSCNACVLVGDRALKRDYLAALENEIKASAEALSEQNFSAVYIGGGSPTTLNPDALAKLIRTIKATLPIDKHAEITVETMPQTVCTPSLGGLKSGGVNRVSLSMQSALQEELETLDCGFTLGDVQNAILFLDRFRLNNVNIDLMCGVPGQTLDTFKKTLRVVRDFAPTHVSLYPFPQDTEEERPCPQEDFFAFATEYLAEYGYERYSTYHFALKGRQSSYWKNRYENAEYVGLGLGARSFVGGFTYTNTTDWETYRDNSSCFENIVTNIAELTAEQLEQYRAANTALLNF